MAAIWLPSKSVGLGRCWVPFSFSLDSTTAAVACKRKEAAAAANLLVSVNCAPAQLNPDTHQETNDFGEEEEVSISISFNHGIYFVQVQTLYCIDIFWLCKKNLECNP